MTIKYRLNWWLLHLQLASMPLCDSLHCRLEEEQQRRRSPEADIEQLTESLVLQN